MPLDQPVALHVLCYNGHASHHCREVIRRGAGRGRCANARRCAVVFSVIAATCVTHSRPSGSPQEFPGCRRRLITLICTSGSGDTIYTLKQKTRAYIVPASFHSVRQVSRALQNRIRRFEVKPKNECAEGSEKMTFCDFFHLKSACSGALLSEIEIVISPQFVGFSARKSPFQGGRLPRGSKLVVSCCRDSCCFLDFLENNGNYHVFHEMFI